MLKRIALLFALLFAPLPAWAAVGTIYIDTGGCESGSTTRCSGTTDSASATVSAAAATITCSATDGPSSTPGCVLSGTPNLSGVATDGSQAIFLNCATNANQKIFWINAVDDSTDRVGTTVTPTGCTASSSDWGIGGRMIYASVNIEAAVRAGDTIQFNNTPATKAAAFITLRVSGDTTTGFINLRGATGVRPVLEVTNTSNVIVNTGSAGRWYVSNLELKQGGASGNAVQMSGNQIFFDNVKISDAGGDCISTNNLLVLTRSELTGCGGWGVNTSASTTAVTVLNGNYIHGNTSGNVQFTAVAPIAFIENNIIAAASGRGVYFNATLTAGVAFIANNTFYGNTTSNLTVANATLQVYLLNNIFQSDGTQFNAVWTAGTIETQGLHSNNIFYISAGSNNVSGLTINSTESTSNPLLTAPGSADFSIGTSSPAKATGFPGQFLGANLGYLDMGAVQIQATSSGSGNALRPGIQ